MIPLIYHDLRYWHPPTHGIHKWCIYEQDDLNIHFRPQEMTRAGKGTGKTTKDIERTVEFFKDYNTLVLCSSFARENVLFEEIYERIKHWPNLVANRSSLRMFYEGRELVLRNLYNSRDVRADKLVICHDIIDQLDYDPSPMHRIRIRKALQQLTIHYDRTTTTVP